MEVQETFVSPEAPEVASCASIPRKRCYDYFAADHLRLERYPLLIDMIYSCIYNDSVEIEWDEIKNAVNIEKHGIDFADAHELFQGDKLVFPDNRKDYGENRFIAVGYIQGRLMIAVYTQRSKHIRIISLRKANSREKARFEETINALRQVQN